MILSVKQIAQLVRKLKEDDRKIVLVGGCFDVLHPGHVVFLEKAKRVGDVLMVLLESDQTVKRIKGVKRPYYNQKNRAKVLSAVKFVDCVVLLPPFEADSAYEQLIEKIKPDVIAVTEGYGDTFHHQRIARLVGAKLKYVTKKVGNHSTSGILNHRHVGFRLQ